MILDFTTQQYITFLNIALKNNYRFIQFHEYFTNPAGNFIILRHDVDKKKEYSLGFAQIQNRLGITGTYYFRAGSMSFDERIILKIADLGHEIGYHYENMDSCKGDADKAYDDFCYNLQKFRKLVPIKTICMHGSPRSKFDNKSLWAKYDYRDLGIIGEPYFDLDFTKVLYLTDTGRRWNGNKYSVRDKIILPDRFQNYNFRSTNQIINALERKQLPEKIMFTFHPQRWTDNNLFWTLEYVSQNVKNVIKKNLFVTKPFYPVNL